MAVVRGVALLGMAPRGPHNSNITWTPHVKVAWGGVLGTSGEVWTNSMKFVHAAENTVLTVDEVTAMNPGVWAALSSWFGTNGVGNINAFIGADAKLSWLKINNITSAGLQYPGATNVYEPGEVGGADANGVPYYQTFALTFRTQLKRGRAHSGRIFPPLVQPVIVAGTGACSQSDASYMASAFRVCMDAMQAAIRAASSIGSFAVCSPGNALKSTTPIYQVITGVVADRVPDVQHRRTNRLPRQEGSLSLVVA